MLPLELLSVVFGALSRADLEALMLVNVIFTDIVLRDFAAEPFRNFTKLYVFGRRHYEFRFTTTSRNGTTRELSYVCRAVEDFHRRMRFGRVGALDFGLATLDEASFDVLLPHADAWRDGHVSTPDQFTSQLLLERSFTELLFCKSMYLLVDDECEPSRPFMSFPAVRQCSDVRVIGPPCLIGAGDLVDWLNAPVSSMDSKTLEIGGSDLGDSVDTVLQRLIEDFTASTTVASYHLHLYSSSYDGNPAGTCVNKTTNETLSIELETSDTLANIFVRRKRNEN